MALSNSTLSSLYSSLSDYLAKFTAVENAAVASGFLLQSDANNSILFANLTKLP